MERHSVSLYRSPRKRHIRQRERQFRYQSERQHTARQEECQRGIMIVVRWYQECIVNTDSISDREEDGRR